MTIDEIIEGRSVVITCGAGGVGKTTSAAAIACRAAALGRKAVVLTIDPARRLAASLGLDSFDSESRPVGLPPDERGEVKTFDAMMLDSRRTFDRLVMRYASEEGAEKILNNRFYRHFTGAVGGSHEYTAMERLYELYEEGKWDLLVLDTPPTVHALDFLDAPQKLIDAFDESIFRWLIKPYLAAGKVGVQVLSFGSAYIVKVLTRIVGGEMIDDLSEFLLLFQELFEGFSERAKAVQNLLHGDKTAFMIVATTQANSLQDARLFYSEIQRMQMPFGGFIINRRMQAPKETLRRARIEQALADAVANDDETFVDRLMAVKKNYEVAAKRQQRNLDLLIESITPKPNIYSIPLMEKDVADVRGLLNFGRMMQKGND